MPGSTQNIIETLQPPNISASKEQPLRVQVLRREASKKIKADGETSTETTRMRIDEKAVNRLLARLKKPRPSTDSQAFVEAPHQSRYQP